MSVREKFDQIQRIFAEAHAQAAPLIADLGPYVDAARRARELGLGPDSTADQIIEAFAKSVDLTPAMRQTIPAMITAGSAETIVKAGEGLIEAHRRIGSTLGSVLGLIATLA